MADIYKIAQSWMGVWVHSGPGLSYPHVGVIYGRDNVEYEVTDRQNSYWLKIGEGRWVCDRDSNGMIAMIKIRTKSEPVPAPAPEPENNNLTEVDEESISWVPDSLNVTSDLTDATFNEDLENYLTISNLRGIFGMPYQFMPSVDPRIDGSDQEGKIGRKYAKEIVSNMPMLLITPGVPVFMDKYNEKDQKNILQLFVNSATDVLGNREGDAYENAISSLASKDFGKYYSLKPDYTEYFKYVNPMCRTAAIYMGLQDVVVDGSRLGTKNWSSAVNDNFSKLFSVYHGCTAWYCDSASNISDSFGNDTTESMVSSKINSLSDYGRELNFLLGTVKTETGWALDKYTSMENLDENMNSQFVDDISKVGGKAGQVFKSLTNSIQTVAAGGKIVFPDIWSGSGFSRSYSINLKLVSPDGDDLSIYLNIIVPLMHLLALTLPREGAKSRGYISPFLVRAFYKGLFNVDMGIVSDLDISKGKEGAWTKSGIPTVVDVSFTIKDLYNDIYMTNEDNNPLSNIILMDYIGNLCGININEPDVIRGINLFLNDIGARVKDTWHLKIFGNLTQFINNKYLRIFSKF